MGRRIMTLLPGKEITYMNEKYVVDKLYTYIAYLRHIDTGIVICVGVGDLVIAGIEPIYPTAIPQVWKEYDFATGKLVEA